jgi:hypothetical protein
VWKHPDSDHDDRDDERTVGRAAEDARGQHEQARTGDQPGSNGHRRHPAAPLRDTRDRDLGDRDRRRVREQEEADEPGADVELSFRCR